MATQREIAQRANVSQMTVSLALNHSPKISEATGRKIRAIAQALSYRPDPMVSALMRQRRRKVCGTPHSKIAFLHSNPKDGIAWVSPHYARSCFKGAMDFAVKSGYLFEAVYFDPEKMSGKRLSQILWTQNVQGLVIAPMPPGMTLECDWDLFAAVCLDYSLPNLNVNRVIDDHMAAMTRLVSHIAELHYTRPGIVMGETNDDRTHHNRLGSFLAHCARMPSFAFIPPLLFNNENWSSERLQLWMREHRPDVIVAGDPFVLASIEASGIPIPRDLGVALYYKDSERQKYSGLTIDPIRVGALAADVLISMIEHNQRGLPSTPTATYVDMTHWDPGETLRNQAQRRRQQLR